MQGYHGWLEPVAKPPPPRPIGGLGAYPNTTLMVPPGPRPGPDYVLRCEPWTVINCYRAPCPPMEMLCKWVRDPDRPVPSTTPPGPSPRIPTPTTKPTTKTKTTAASMIPIPEASGIVTALALILGGSLLIGALASHSEIGA